MTLPSSPSQRIAQMMTRALPGALAIVCAYPTAALAYSPTPANTERFIALCYPHDEATITPGRDQTFYQNLFFSSGTGSAQDYWISQSYGHVAFVDSIMTGWTDTGLSLTQHKHQTRAENTTACVSAALGKSNWKNFNFYNYIAVYNGQLDEGMVPVTIQGKQVNADIIDAYSPQTGILHEMGHGFGLGHSYNDQNVEYGDPYDIMSALNVYPYAGNHCVPPGGWYACDSGPGLNAWTRWQLGWLRPAQRQMWWPASSGAPLMTETVTLAARNEPPGALPQILYVPTSSTAMYTVEWIDTDNYDLDNLFASNQSSQPSRPATNTLTIHNIKYGNQTTYLVTAPGGVQTAPGTPFYDSVGGVHIELTSTGGSPATATVQVTVDPTSSVWANGATSGTPPADSNKMLWVGVDAAAGDSLVPPNAVNGGYDPNGGNLYSCRTWYFGVQLGKVVSGQCSFPWGGKEHFQSELFETLTSLTGANTAWVSGSNGSLPADALAAGFDGTNTLYVCRAQINGNWTPGKFIFGQCDVSSGGNETWHTSYEILTASDIRAA